MAQVLLIDPALKSMTEAFRERLPASVAVAAISGFDDEEFARLAADAEILVNARRRVDAGLLALAPRARFVQMIGIGRDSIDVAAVRAAGISAAYNPGVNAVGVAEQTLMLMLALVKRLPYSEQMTRAGRFATGEFIGVGLDDLADATVGLIGMGDIGQEVAKRLTPFGPRIVYNTRARREEIESSLGVTWLPLPDLLQVSNIVSLHLPLTTGTHHLIGEAEFAAMPKGAYLINTGRGGLVDEAALRREIESRHLTGAALDVLEHENDGGNPFADLPAVIVTPHVGGGSRGSVARMVERCAANIERFLAGEPVHDLVPGLGPNESTA
jgi:phosphoglycerate dehydrogenase-like enzyme